MAKILVVDDDSAINELIKVNLELAYYSVITAEDGNKGYALAKQELPDLIILDVMMPEVDGFTVAKRIRENSQTKDIPILMLTALNMLQNKVQGFNIGVDDYLVKPFEMEELLLRVKAILKRSDTIPKSIAIKEVLTKGDITLIPEIYTVEINGKQAKVTPIEFDIINLLMQNYGNMVSSAKILQDVWGYSADDAVETIRVHMRHIRTKIDKISNGKKYIETIYGGGYRLIPDGVTK